MLPPQISPTAFHLFYSKTVILFCLNLVGLFLHVQAEDVVLPEKPNIVFIMSDDQGYGDVGYYDHPTLKTPNLDEMSKTGIRLDQYYTSSGTCSPTRASTLTGRYPRRTG